MSKKKKSVSEKLQDELEPIWHPTEFDESDDIEQAKKAEEIKPGSMKEKVLKGPDKDWRKGTIWERDKEEK